MSAYQNGMTEDEAAYTQGRQAGVLARQGIEFDAPVMLDKNPSWRFGYEAGLRGDLLMSVPQPKAPEESPLVDRILAALGGLRDDMPPEDVRAVQRFVDRLRAST